MNLLIQSLPASSALSPTQQSILLSQFPISQEPKLATVLYFGHKAIQYFPVGIIIFNFFH